VGKSIIIVILLTALLCQGVVKAQGWELVWSDEFDGVALNTDKWSIMTGDGTEYGIPGWGNNELQYYRAENVKVSEGNLVITARRESFGGKGYTSGRIRSLGKGDWTYARIEFRARMALGQGMWSAIWMLPSAEVYGGWAASGEIDIVECIGHEPSVAYGTLHYGGQWPNNTQSGMGYTTDSWSFAQQFHDFALEWEEGEMRWYVDGNLYQTQSSWRTTAGAPFPAPFDQEFHLLINLAVGGNWPGAPDATTRFPQELTVDYIRVYQRTSTGLKKTDGGSAPGIRLEQNLPNPFTENTTITFHLPAAQQISLEMFDSLGRSMGVLREGMHQPGTYTHQLDGKELSRGLYYIRLRTGESDLVRRLVRY
jgi:beta-glucanase (GH16 family)